MPAAPFPTVPDGRPVVLSPAVYRRIVAMLVAMADPAITGARNVDVDANGRLSLAIDPGGGPGVVLAQISGTVDTDGLPVDQGGDGGSGTGDVLSGFAQGDSLPTGVYLGRVAATYQGTLGDFALPFINGNDPLVYLQDVRSFASGADFTHRHDLLPGSYCWAFDSGRSASDGKSIYYLTQMMSAPTAKYQVPTAVDDTLRVVWTTCRFTDEAGYPAAGSGDVGEGTGTGDVEGGT